MWPFNDTAMGSLIYALQALCLYCPAMLLVGDVHLNPKRQLPASDFATLLLSSHGYNLFRLLLKRDIATV